MGKPWPSQRVLSVLSGIEKEWLNDANFDRSRLGIDIIQNEDVIQYLRKARDHRTGAVTMMDKLHDLVRHLKASNHSFSSNTLCTGINIYRPLNAQMERALTEMFGDY